MAPRYVFVLAVRYETGSVVSAGGAQAILAYAGKATVDVTNEVGELVAGAHAQSKTALSVQRHT